MKNFLQTHIEIAVHLTLIACAIVVGTLVTHYQQKEVTAQIDAKISTQEKYLFELAEIIDRNGADAAISSIISDCPQRNEYETHLNALGTLSKKELVIAQALFENCGGFFSEQKALMVAKLERELLFLEDLVALRSVFGDIPKIKENTAEWRTLVTHEQTRSALLHDQQLLQAKIITLLISGSLPTSNEVQLLLVDANEIYDLLGVHDYKIDEVRSKFKF